MNNSALPAPKRNPHARHKISLSLEININSFIKKHGTEHCGLLTLVFPGHVRWEQASSNLTKLQRVVLDPLFLNWICVVELHKDRRPHFHLLVAAKQNLRRGYDFESRELAKDLKDLAANQNRRLNPDEATAYKELIKATTRQADELSALWKGIRAKLPHYGFGRSYPGTLEPVICPNRIAKYLTKSFGNKAIPRPAEMKGARLLRYSRNQQRSAYQNFGWGGNRSARRRLQLSSISAAIGVDEHDFRTVFGPRWNYHATGLIEYLTSPDNAPEDGTGWSDTEIRAAADGTYVAEMGFLSAPLTILP